MAFTRRLERIMPAFGVPRQNDLMFLEQGFALSGTGTIRMPPVGSFVPVIAAGRIRVKITPPVGGVTMTSITVTLNDAAGNSEVLSIPVPGGSIVAPATIMALSSFLSELNVTFISVVAVSSAGTATVDVEIAPTSGDA